MLELRPYCLTIAGFDPSAGAGVMADIKTFEVLKCYGLGAATGITYQNDFKFEGVHWQTTEQIKKQLVPLANYPVKAVKIGLVENMETLKVIVTTVKSLCGSPFIVWDPVLQASAGFEFMNGALFSKNDLFGIDLITPNNIEFEKMNMKVFEGFSGAILLKGGHREEKYATDTLYFENSSIDITGEPFENKVDKHGTGCVLSSAIAAHRALGCDLVEACKRAKRYTEKIILSNPTQLGYHSI